MRVFFLRLRTEQTCEPVSPRDWAPETVRYDATSNDSEVRR